jgi:hypothetical protein
MSTGEVKIVNGKRVASPEYRSWQMMKNRVLNRRAQDFRYYGGRGIGMSLDWAADFDVFLADMGRKPTLNHTLERRDNNKSYTKDNCFWATRQTQARNRSIVKLSIEMANEIRRLYATGRYRQKDLAKQFGSTQAGISQIVRNASWRSDDRGGPQ